MHITDKNDLNFSVFNFAENNNLNIKKIECDDDIIAENNKNESDVNIVLESNREENNINIAVENAEEDNNINIAAENAGEDNTIDIGSDNFSDRFAENFAVNDKILMMLEQIIVARKKEMSEKSYTARLFLLGEKKIGEKVQEETEELLEAVQLFLRSQEKNTQNIKNPENSENPEKDKKTGKDKKDKFSSDEDQENLEYFEKTPKKQRRDGSGLLKGTREHIIHEAADLVYHLTVFLTLTGVSWMDVEQELKNRFGISGLQEQERRINCKNQ